MIIPPGAVSSRWLAACVGAGLGVLLVCAPGCGGPARPAMDSYLAQVTNATPDQTAADAQVIAKLFAGLAAQRGLVAEKPLPTDNVALYFPATTGLNLSLSALNSGGNSITLSVVPVALGKKDNAACRAVMAEVEAQLKQAFGQRLVRAP